MWSKTAFIFLMSSSALQIVGSANLPQFLAQFDIPAYHVLSSPARGRGKINGRLLI
jgi:hypothetical protein